MELFLTAKQKSNFMKGNKPIQISRKQMMGGALNATHQMRINLNDLGKKKVEKAMRQQKGFRLQPGEHEGGSLLKKLGKTALKVASNEKVQDFVIDQGMNAYNNYMYGQGGFLQSVKNTAKKAGKTIKKAKIGKTLESVKDAIPQELVESTIKTALMSQGMSAEEADAIAAAGTSTVYGYSFDEKPTKKNFSSAIQDGVQAGFESGLTSAMSGNGIFQKNSLYKKKGYGFQGSGVGFGFKGSGGRPPKGSQQAKDKMAMIRAMKKSGGSFRDY
jgi:hypothetical protein